MFSWIKRNKLASVLFLVVVYFFGRTFLGIRANSFTGGNLEMGYGGITQDMGLKSAPSSINRAVIPSADYSPTESADRLVVQTSNLSLVVKDVREASDKVIDYAKDNGGYMVSSSLSQPKEAPYSLIVLRVPSKNLKTTIEYFRSLSIKISSENLYGTDVTDQYTDLEARLAILNKTKNKFQEIMNQAIKVQDMLDVQRELINVQSQIDSIKGQQQYLEKTAEMAKITLNLSTDEFSLPYAPAEPFRPANIFKSAVRSLVGVLRGIVILLIWIGVFSVIWIPVLLIRFFIKRKKRLQK
jgi:hypothetical protein